MADREKAPPSRVWSEGGAPRASKKVTPLRLAFGAREGAAVGEGVSSKKNEKKITPPSRVWSEGGAVDGRAWGEGGGGDGRAWGGGGGRCRGGGGRRASEGGGWRGG